MKKYLTLIAIAILSVACETKLTDGLTTNEAPVPILLGSSMQGAATRSISQTLQATELEKDTEVGVFIYYSGDKESTTHSYGYKNVKYTVKDPTGSGVTPGDLALASGETQPYFPEDKTQVVDVYAFAPRSIYTAQTADLSGLAPLTPLTAEDVFSTKADQTTDANYCLSDFVWGTGSSASTSSAIQINMAHKLSKVNINIAAGTGMTLAKLDKAKIILNGVLLDGTVDFTTGAVTLRADDPLIPYTNNPSPVTLTDNSCTFAQGKFSDGVTDCYTSSAVIIPQTIAASATTTVPVNIISIQLWDGSAYGTAYNVAATSGHTFAAGTAYNYDITINAGGLSLTTSITDWTSGGTTTGTAE